MVGPRLSQMFISIHAPREGGDVSNRIGCAVIVISIHAPREGGDKRGISQAYQPDNFNPRPPRGGRPLRKSQMAKTPVFQSTPPARGATKPP